MPDQVVVDALALAGLLLPDDGAGRLAVLLQTADRALARAAGREGVAVV